MNKNYFLRHVLKRKDRAYLLKDRYEIRLADVLLVLNTLCPEYVYFVSATGRFCKFDGVTVEVLPIQWDLHRNFYKGQSRKVFVWLMEEIELYAQD